MSAKIEIPNASHLIECYQSGMSENKLAKLAGIGRTAMRKFLVGAGVDIRSQSEAERLKWSQMPEAIRTNQVRAAHEAARGRVHSFEERAARAKTNETSKFRASPVESMLIDWLLELAPGLSITPQKAVGVYNIDVAINEPTIAVEIFGGGWHASGSHRTRFFERVPYLVNECGYHLIVVWVDGRKYPLDINGARKVISLAQLASALPPGERLYAMVLGNGNLAPAVGTKFNTRADVERLGGRFNEAGGIHIIPR